jgi:hypothetical protein
MLRFKIEKLQRTSTPVTGKDIGMLSDKLQQVDLHLDALQSLKLSLQTMISGREGVATHAASPPAAMPFMLVE